MTDQPNDTAPAATPEPMSVEMATSRKAELMADAEWGARYVSGGAAERAEMAEIFRALGQGPQVHPDALSMMDRTVDHLRECCGGYLEPEIEAEFREQRPVSPAEHSLAKMRLSERKSDKAFLTRYLDGEVAARREMTSIAFHNQPACA